MSDFWDDDEMEDPDRERCENCGDLGKVPTDDHESYLGAMYKPCFMCNGAANQSDIGERQLS